MLKSLIQSVTPFQQNASILFCSETKQCAIIDPGGDIDVLMNLAKENNLIPEKILLTHGHIDHAGGATELSEILKIEIHGPHIEDKFLLDSLQSQGEMFGMPSKNCYPNKWFDDLSVPKSNNKYYKIYKRFFESNLKEKNIQVIFIVGKNKFNYLSNHFLDKNCYTSNEINEIAIRLNIEKCNFEY